MEAYILCPLDVTQDAQSLLRGNKAIQASLHITMSWPYGHHTGQCAHGTEGHVRPLRVLSTGYSVQCTDDDGLMMVDGL